MWTKCRWLFYCNLWIAKELCVVHGVGGGGSGLVLKRGGVENGLEVRCWIVLPFTHRPQRHPLNEGRPETEGGVTDREPKSYSRSFFLFFLDTQSSLKLTTVYAVLEDSHWGGPVLLERLKRRRHARTHTHNTENIKAERRREIMGRNVVCCVYMQHNIMSERPTCKRTCLYSSHLMPDNCTCFILQPFCVWVTQELCSRSRYFVSAKRFW